MFTAEIPSLRSRTANENGSSVGSESSQIIIFHQPGFSGNKGISLPKRYLLGVFGRVRSLQIDQI